MTGRRIAPPLAVLLVLTAWAGFARSAEGPALPVELSLREPAGVARPAWPVTSGVPLPQGAVKEVGELGLLDGAGAAVPCQIEEVCRWPDGSLKWVHLSFQADLAAGAELKYRLARAGPARIAGALEVSDAADAVTIDTGAARIVISRKTGSIVESLEAGGRKVLEGRGLTLTGSVKVAGPIRNSIPVKRPPVNVTGPSFDRQEIRINSRARTETWKWRVTGEHALKLVGSVTGEDGEVSSEDVKGGKIWTSRSGSISVRTGWWSDFKQPTAAEVGEDQAYYQFGTDASAVGKRWTTLKGKLEEVKVEKSGPLVACIYLQGTFSDEEGKPFIPTGEKYKDAAGDFFKHRTRVYAYAGKPYVHIVPAITHLGPKDGSPRAAFGGISMEFALPDVRAETPVELAGAGGKVGERARVLQLLGVTPFTEMQNRRKPSYAVTLAGAEAARGEKATGSCVLGTGGSSLGAGLRRFWEYAPKGLTVEPGRLVVELWPEVGEFDGYSLCMGRQRSHELLLSASPEAAKELAAFQAPRLVLTAPGAWYADCGVFGLVAEERNYRAGGYPAEQIEALERFEKLQKCVVDDSFRQGGRKSLLQDEFVPGWNDYGDLPWAEGWCNLHYDWTMITLLHFLRTGKREFFDVADAMAWHRKDIAQNHCGQCGLGSSYSLWSNYLTYYEKDDHRGVGQGPKPSHTWNRGVAYWYLLTGDPTARLVAVQTAEGLRGFYSRLVEGKGTAADAGAELRMYGWTIENFLGAYEVTGDRKYLDWAVGLCNGTFGAIREGKTVESADKMHPLMYGYSLSPLCRLHHYSRDEKVLAALRYMVDEAVLKRFLKLGGPAEGGRYQMSMTPYSWSKEAWEKGTLKHGNPVWNLFWGNPAAYMYMQTGEERYLKLSRQLFREAMYYYASGGDPKDPAYRCSLAYNDGMFSSTATKAHGWAGRFNQIYLYMEKKLTEGARFPEE